MIAGWSHFTRAWHALVAYLAIAIAATWPLAAGLGRDLASDLGDPLFVAWVLSWDCEQLLRILSGDISRVGTFFDANIFHPARLTLAYSEHLLPQALQVLPIYAVTGNPILCYNLLFLSTFVLSGLGTYLYVRALTANPLAAFVAGLAFAFAPYRWPQSSHLQVLSAQWMPFVLFGFHRFFERAGRLSASQTTRASSAWALAGGTAAVVVQNLSSAYYLFYFAPFVAAYCLWEIGRRRLWRNAFVWTRLALSAVATLVLTIPVLLPYVAVSRDVRAERTRDEVVRYSADVYSYLTAHPDQVLWGNLLQTFPKPEGDLFPGLAVLLLAVTGVLFAGHRRMRADLRGERVPRSGSAIPSGADASVSRDTATSRSPSPVPAGIARYLSATFATLAAVHLLAFVAVLFLRRIVVDLGPFTLRMSDATQLLLRAVIAVALLFVVAPAARRRAVHFMNDRGFYVVAALVAIWLSLGPSPRALGRPVDLVGPYAVLMDIVPGFDGMRAAARFAMISTSMLAVLAGLGATVVCRGRYARAIVAALSVLIVGEGLLRPFPVNGQSPVPGYQTPDARLQRPARAPAVYNAVAELTPRDAVIAELPLGIPDFDLRAMYYSTAHWRRLVNGYSGFFPAHYGDLNVGLSDLAGRSAAALAALRSIGTTHVVLHEQAYLNGEGENASAALRKIGAVELFRDDSDVLLALPPP